MALQTSRRGFFLGLGAALVTAPAIVHSINIMPIKAIDSVFEWGPHKNFRWPEMAFSIEKVSVTARSRVLSAEYTFELAQDLKTIYNFDAAQELTDILTEELKIERDKQIYDALVGNTSEFTERGLIDPDRIKSFKTRYGMVEKPWFHGDSGWSERGSF